MSFSERRKQERHQRDRKLNTATDEGCFNLTLAAGRLTVIQNVTTRMVLADDELRCGSEDLKICRKSRKESCRVVRRDGKNS